MRITDDLFRPPTTSWDRACALACALMVLLLWGIGLLPAAAFVVFESFIAGAMLASTLYPEEL